MKPITLLLAASLIANGAFVAWLVTKSSPPPAPISHSETPGATAEVEAGRKADALRAALVSGDAAALEAAGVSPEIARELAIGRTFARMAEKIRAAQARNTSEQPWWRTRPGLGAPGTREQQLVARRELSDALITAFGDDLGLGGANQSQLAFLEPAKGDALRRIVQDYDEMMAKFSSGGIQLASDREKLRLLRLERERDIAALLTPDEKLAYEMRTSSSGNSVKYRYGDAIESEAEFQKIFALQKAFDEQYSREALAGRISPEVLRARAEAERQLEASIRAAVGEDRFAALRRAADPDLRTLDALASRLNLPSTVTDNVIASRETYATASQRIANDTSLSPDVRRTQLQALAEQVKSELSSNLGTEAADAYAQRSPWINMLKNGMAYATTPPEGTIVAGTAQSVYPVPPAGAGPAGGQRQVLFNAAQRIDGAVVSDTIISSDAMPNVPFIARPPVDPSARPADGVATRQVIITPAPGTAVPPPASTTPAPRR